MKKKEAIFLAGGHRAKDQTRLPKQKKQPWKCPPSRGKKREGDTL